MERKYMQLSTTIMQNYCFTNSISHHGSHSDRYITAGRSFIYSTLQLQLRGDFYRCNPNSAVASVNRGCARFKMKTMVLLFTATLFAVCGAFPTYEKISRGQQSNEFCATLVHPQNDSAAYVHLCYTPRKGNTRCLSVKSTPTSAFEFSPRNSHVDDSVSNHTHCAIYSQCVCYACLVS